MSTSRCHLKGSFYTLLTFYVGKVLVAGILLCIEFLFGIHYYRLKCLTAVEEGDDISQIIDTIHIEAMNHSRF